MFYVRIHIVENTDFVVAVREAIDFASRLRCQVRFNFAGLEYSVDAETSEEEVIKTFYNTSSAENHSAIQN